MLPNSITTGSTEVGGILLCLSCHDGNLTASNMMTNQSYEQKIGLLTNTAYGNTPIPTLLGNDGTTAGNYTNDHPVGVNATSATMSAYGLRLDGTENDGDRRHSLCPVRCQLRLAGSGAWKVVPTLTASTRLVNPMWLAPLATTSTS